MKTVLSMNKFLRLLIFICGCLCLCACSDKAKDDFSNILGVQNETWSSVVRCNPNSDVLVYTFDALGDWTVVSSDDWCKVFPAFGYKGKSNLKIVVDRNETESFRTATITINVERYKNVTISLEQEVEEIVEKPDSALSMNIVMDDFLEEYYLWNDDYKEFSRDLTIPYVDSYEKFLKTTLMVMTTNTLDKKKQITGYDTYGNPIYEYMLYSYVDRRSKGGVTRSVKTGAGVSHGIEKVEKRSYGFSSIEGIDFVNYNGELTGKFGLVVQTVYPNSSASLFDIRRGMIITHVNGREITKSNYVSSYLELLNPTQSNIKLLVEYPDSVSEVVLASTMIEPTPILKNKVLEVGENRIGYLMYDSFDAAYDDDLLNVLANFKSKNITDLILDLRYNGGGYVISSNMLSACLVGNGCRDRIFHYYRYNDRRMADIEGTQKSTGNIYDKVIGLFGEKYMYDDYYGVNLAPYSLDLKRLFVLTTNSTASASEALINALRGHGIHVVIIGEETNGKNVGMEAIEFNSGGYTYELAPITFQGYNEKKQTVPSNGFAVDYAVADWNNGYADFCDFNEPMFYKAYELITGASRSAVATYVPQGHVNGRILHLPIVNRRPEGMIVRVKQ